MTLIQATGFLAAMVDWALPIGVFATTSRLATFAGKFMKAR